MRWALAWMLFWLGDAVSRLMRLAKWLGYLYPVYSRLMGASSDVQGDSDNGPWSATLAPSSNIDKEG